MDKNEKKSAAKPFGIELLERQEASQPTRVKTGVKAGGFVHSDDIREGGKITYT